MSDLSDSAVLEPKKKKQARPKDDKPKPQPPYAVIVLNDDLHTFPYVIETFQKVFGYPAEKGHQLAEEIVRKRRQDQRLQAARDRVSRVSDFSRVASSRADRMDAEADGSSAGSEDRLRDVGVGNALNVPALS